MITFTRLLGLVTALGLFMSQASAQIVVIFDPFTSSGLTTSKANSGTGCVPTTTANVIVGDGAGGCTASSIVPNTVVTGITNDTNVTGSISTNVLTLGWTGTLALTRGGLGANQSAITKGGLLVGTAAATVGIKAIGTDGQILTADAASAGGMKWADAAAGGVTSVVIAGTANQISVAGTCTITTTGTCTLSIPTSPTLPGTTTGTFSGNLTGNASGSAATITGLIVEANTPLTTKGDLLVEDGSTLHRLGVGSNGQALVADSTATDGLKWASIGGGSGCTTAGSATQILTDDGAGGCSSSGVTIDGSNNISTAGGISTGVGGSVAGYSAYAQGTATTAPTSSVGFMAPASVTTKFMMKLPAAPTAGFIFNTGITDPTTLSFIGISGTGSVCMTTNCLMTTPTGDTITATTGFITGADNSSAGSVQVANGSANAHTIFQSGATTTNTIKGFATVPTTGRLLDCTVTSTTCLLHDSGITTANVVNASSPGAGIAHFAGSTQTVTSSALLASEVPAVALTTGTSITLSNSQRFFECTGTCTVTMPIPSAGVQYCVRNANNVATVITFAAIGSSAMYEVTAKTSYGTAGTGTLVSGGNVLDQMCLVGKDSTHYDIYSYAGAWTAN